MGLIPSLWLSISDGFLVGVKFVFVRFRFKPAGIDVDRCANTGGWTSPGVTETRRVLSSFAPTEFCVSLAVVEAAPRVRSGVKRGEGKGGTQRLAHVCIYSTVYNFLPFSPNKYDLFA